ncbi:MAG: thiol reductant ABC exporter subunit CydC [Actinobacteria bacterium]|nr:thiol reductant ABC exporter subunit CydC [Micrococcales bacterium]MCB0904617.1 thiol reductant ABC exporter subunit CydC [Actinomycetota bacterium]HPE14077.1 thiol reductant ABC exporter subunit CydC [Actinomycetota bacterium]HPQ84958.1 thiol reductant ABC exporter subunit CydC [Actinomycetota bacterium]HRV67731.1 thiol reductant ABC exporter subunit CydC [Candidatus Nanopelagicales bacterium]
MILRDPAVRRLREIYRPATGRLWWAAVLGALALGSSVGLMAVSAWLISRAWEQPPILFLQVAVVSVRAFGIGRGVFRYAERLVSHQAAFRSLVDLRVALYERLIPLAPAGLPAFKRGDLLRRMVDDVETMSDLSLRVMLPIFSAILVGTGSVILTAWLLPASGVILAVCLLLGGIAVPALIIWSSGRGQAAQAPLQAELSSEVLTALQAGPELMVLGADDAYGRRIEDVDARLAAAMRKTAVGSALSTALGILVQGAAVIGMILVAVPAVRAGDLWGVNLAVVVLLPLAAYESVAVLAPSALAAIRVRTAAGRLVEILDAQPPVSDPAAPQAADGATVVARGLSASYPTGPVAVGGVDFYLPVGHRIGLVGESGSGKSTVLNVLAGFLKYSGDVRLGGRQLSELAGDDIRSLVLWTPQIPHVFDADVAANLRMAKPDATDEQLLDALAAVGLPMDLHRPVGQHGATLSGGERQRLGLARAVLADHPVLLLDEPTEHLDPPTAQAVLDTIAKVSEGRSLVVVTHQPIPWLDEHVEVRTPGRS